MKELRNNVFTIRLTDAEIAAIKKEAEELGVPPRILARMKLGFDSTITPQTPKKYYQ